MRQYSLIALIVWAVGWFCTTHAVAQRDSLAEQSPVLGSLTDANAEKLFRVSLARLCAEVNRSRQRGMPIVSDTGPWPGMQVPAASMLGMVLLGEGNTLQKGPHAATLRKLFPYVRQAGSAPHESIDRYRTWVISFGLIFLSEMHRVAPSDALKTQLQRMADLLEKGAYPGGGWGHTLERKLNKYAAFTAATVWAVTALKSAEARGVRIDKKQLQQNIVWIRKTFGKSGGSFYSVKTRYIVSPGRTAGAAWVLDCFDAEASASQIKKAVSFIVANVKFTPEGHASGMMNFGWGALASQQIGGDLATAFFKTHTKSLYKARRMDGTFAMQNWRDIGFPDARDARPFQQKQPKTTPDQTAGDGWAAVWMLTSWQAARGKSLLSKQRAPDVKQAIDK